MTTETLTLQSLDLPRGARIPEWADPDAFISPDPPPLPDAMHQEPSFSDVLTTLRRHLRGRPDWETTLISGHSFVYYNRDDLNDRYLPDCYVAFNVDVDAIWSRNGYMVWVGGKPPDFALEIASKSTGGRDMGIKRRDYARIGIREYWRFDATGGDYHDAPLAGARLVNGRYEPIPTHTEPDGSIWGYSEILELWLCWDSGYLLFWNPKTRSFLRNIDAADDARQAAEDRVEASEEARQAVETALTEERAARQLAENALQAAEETIRRLRAQSGGDSPD